MIMNSGNALKIDLYELTMAAGYFQNKVDSRAVFELSCHTMPHNRSFLVSCGLEQVVEYILNLKFSEEDISFLKSLPVFQNTAPGFWEYLKGFKFSGDVWAMPEGEIFFAREPVIQIEAPVIEAQILETYLLSVVNIESLVATKAARIVEAARADGVERGVVDFGSRRAHGPEAGVLAARAAYIAGCLGTSNVFAGRAFGIPVYGTVAHSWVEAFDSEQEAFENYHKVFPENTILLIDTYDTIACAKEIVRLPFKEKLKGVRLDSGNLLTLSKKVRGILDQAGLRAVKILASGNLNEYKISDLVKAKAPIDIFGVGTDMATSRDYPALDLTYKLAQTTDQRGVVHFKAKHSPKKKTVPGRKQVFRRLGRNGFLSEDTVGLAGENAPPGARPLLEKVIERGRLLGPLPSLQEARRAVFQNLQQLPPRFFDLHKRCVFKPKYTDKILKITV
jgi:nicotinate phosphoribosyltransferase